VSGWGSPGCVWSPRVCVTQVTSGGRGWRAAGVRPTARGQRPHVRDVAFNASRWLAWTHIQGMLISCCAIRIQHSQHCATPSSTHDAPAPFTPPSAYPHRSHTPAPCITTCCPHPYKPAHTPLTPLPPPCPALPGRSLPSARLRLPRRWGPTRCATAPRARAMTR
jgi:hypothetical protein